MSLDYLGFLQKIVQEARFGPLINLGPMVLIGTLGTHFENL